MYRENTKQIENAIAKGKELEVLEPFLVDYRTRFHVRQLAGLLKMNHATVALTLKRLEAKKVLKSEQEGRNKKYCLDLDNILTKSYLENAESVKTMKYFEKHFLIKKMLSEFLPVIFKETSVVLFGSYANKSYTNRSDIDILLIKNGNEEKISKAMKDFGKKQNRKIQIQKMSKRDFEDGLREKDVLISEIIRNHIILNNISVIVDILWRYYNEVR